MIVTTDAGARYEITEVGRGLFQVKLLNPEIVGRRNPWTGETRDYVVPDAVEVGVLELTIGQPFAFDADTGQQIPPSWLREHGYPTINRITAIEP